MVQFRMIHQRSSDTIERVFKERADALKKRVAEKMADAIIERSPVDTGTYVLAHTARPEATEYETRSSHGRPRGRNPNQFKALARGNLMRSVAAWPATSNELFFRNVSAHAGRVEHLGWNGVPAYRVYADTRAEAPRYITDAARELGFT